MTGDRYSRSVQVAKIALPLIAIGILSTLFLVSGGVDPDQAVPYADVDVTAIARDQRLSNPRFAGVGRDGAAIELSAKEARPLPGEDYRVNVSEITGSVVLPNASSIELSAGSALFDMNEQIAGLKDDVVVISSLGYRVEATQLMARLDLGSMESNGPVNVQTPFGSLEAGNMLLTESDGRYRMVFNNKVKLVYLPANEE